MRANGFKVEGGRFRLDVWRKVFPDREQLVDAPGLEAFKARQDGAVGGVPAWSRGLELDDLKSLL